MSIGDALTQAREQAGLSVADVSAQTRIRPNLIRAIERDDFAACGGDFYARGHIRAIARAVGADSLPLISEYDAAHPGARPATLDDLLGNAVPAAAPASAAAAGQGAPAAPERDPGPPPAPGDSILGPAPAGPLAGTYQGPRRSPHGPNPWRMLPIIFGALAVIGVGVYRVSAEVGGPSPQSAAASGPAASHPGSPAASASPSGRAASPSLSPSASPTPRVSALTVRPRSVAAFGPGGTSDGDNPQAASKALSGESGSPWQSQWYTTSAFGNLKSGTGLLFDLGRAVRVTEVSVRLGDTSGASFKVRAGNSVSRLHTVASVSGASSQMHVHLKSPVSARYVVVWFTALPPDGNGTYRAAVSGLTVSAVSG